MEYFYSSWCQWNNSKWHYSFKFLSRKKCYLHSCECNDLVSKILYCQVQKKVQTFFLFPFTWTFKLIPYSHLIITWKRTRAWQKFILSRMDCVYRLLYSMIAVHYRNYMLTSALLQPTSGNELVCVIYAPVQYLLDEYV